MTSPYLNKRPRSEVEVLAAQLDHINQKIDLRYEQLHNEHVHIMNEARELFRKVDLALKKIEEASS